MRGSRGCTASARTWHSTNMPSAARTKLLPLSTLRQTPSHESVWHQYLARSFLDRDQALRDYDAGKFLHSATGGGEHRPSSFYGESIIPRAYVEQHWTRDLELVDFVDEPTRLPQALIVLKHR